MKKKIITIAAILSLLITNNACNSGTSDKTNGKDSAAATTAEVKDNSEAEWPEVKVKKTDVEKLGLSGKVKHLIVNINQGPYISGIEEGGDMSSEYFFNEAGYTTKMIHHEAGSSETSLYTYDAKNRLTDLTVIDEDDKKLTEHHKYEQKDGNTVVSFKGLYSDGIITETYDAKGQLISRVTGDYKTTYKYHKSGRILEERNNSDVTTYEYDNKGRLVKEIMGDITTSYNYDANGNLKEKLEDGFDYDPETEKTTKISQGRKSIYKRGSNGKLTEVEYNFGKDAIIVVKYNNDEKMSEVVAGNNKFKFEYASNGALKQVSNNGKVVAKYDTSKEISIEIDPIKTQIQLVEYYK